MPDMNRELFEQWVHDPNLTVLSQDEDLMIGTGDNLALLEEFLRRRDVAPGKREVLLSAICVVLFDNLPDDDDQDGSRDPDFAAEAAEILKRNMGAFDEINEDFIGDYIKEVVYPVIGRPIKTEA